MLLTATIAAGLLVVAAAATWIALRPAPVYRPGEAIDGLTAQLARSLPADYPRVKFVDVTEQAGITFRHFSGDRSSQLPEDMGSGAAWGDYDRDGWPDLYVVNIAGRLGLSPDELAASPAHAVLYRNNGDGTFADVTAAAGVAFRGWGMGAAWADYDNDGWPDLVVTAFGQNVLYRNNGDGTFRDRTAVAGLAGPNGFWAGASWGDYDRDGLVDLHIAGYVRYRPQLAGTTSSQYDAAVPASLNPSSFAPERNLLYHNNGDGTFTEVAASAGVLGDHGRGMGAVWSDLDEDGWPDLYVANDVSDNVLYRNRNGRRFEDISHTARVADYRGAMGLAVGDWDGDADMDLFVTHWIAQENALFRHLRAELAARPAPPRDLTQFADVADRYGLGQISLDFIGWGTFFFDYDNDGRLDLFVANGSTFQDDERPERLVPMRDQLFWNRGPDDGFYDVSRVSGEYFHRSLVGRGAAYADHDGDGDLDVFVVNHGGEAVLLRNDGGNERGWLQVALEGRRSNRSAIGAKLRLVCGDMMQVREVGAQSSYLSRNSLVEHFGLGPCVRVDSLIVTWPAGGTDVLTGLAGRRRLNVAEGNATP